MLTAIYTRLIYGNKEEPHKPSAVETSHKTAAGKTVKDATHTYHHGAEEDYSHRQAAIAHCYRFKLDNWGGDLRQAQANDGKHAFIFI